MRSLRKISPSPYADSMHNVTAYSGDGWGFEIAEPDATNVEIPTDREVAIAEAHSDASASVTAMTGAMVMATAVTGNLEFAPITGGIMFTARAYLDCYVSCHDQSPPVEPSYTPSTPPRPEDLFPVPEIETEEEEEEKKEK